MDSPQRRLQPTADHPQLLGLIIDVSLSMVSSIWRSSSGRQQNKLESVQDALDALVAKAAHYCELESNYDTIPKMHLFAYGFGFGNARSFFAGWEGSNVQDLLALPDDSWSTIGIDTLVRDWPKYRNHVRRMARHAGGSTPMVKALTIARQRLRDDRLRRPWTDQPVLFILSDGMPSDGEADEILAITESLKAEGVLVMTCLLAETEVAMGRRLYGAPSSSWPAAANLMFNCSSVLGDNLPFHDQLEKELGWIIDPAGRLFSFVDSSKSLSDFLDASLSRLRPDDYQPTTSSTSIAAPNIQRSWDFFISYTQADQPWAEWIAWVLEEDGYRVLIQAWDFVPGTNWLVGMQAGTCDAARTIAVLSDAYLESIYGSAEWQAAWSRDPDGTYRKLLTVRISDCEWPGLLAGIVGVNLSGTSEAESRSELRRMVRGAISGRAKPAEAPGFPGTSRVIPSEPDFPGELHPG